MQYIPASNRIEFYRYARLSPDYQNTINFDSAGAQTAFFTGKLAHAVDEQSYQRPYKGECIVELTMADLTGCGYMSFVCEANTAILSNKRYYCFITSIEYVNPVTTRVYYEIDLLQTWFFDYRTGPCYIERMSTRTDDLGDNLQPEPFDSAPILLTEIARIPSNPAQKQFYVIHATEKYEPDGDVLVDIQEGDLVAVNRVLNGVWIGCMDEDTMKKCLACFIRGGRESSIISVTAVPRITEFENPNSYVPMYAPARLEVKADFNFAVLNAGMTGEEYRPKNKKLFGPPFTRILVDGTGGDTAEYNPLFFANTGDITFEYEMTVASKCAIRLTPMNYRGVQEDHLSSFTCDSFPIVAFSGDTYKVWFAQNLLTVGSRLVQGAATTLAAGAVNPVGGAVAGGKAVGDILNVAGEAFGAMMAPDQAHGGSGTNALDWSEGRTGFVIYQCVWRKEFLQMADDFFTMYGYAINHIETPQKHNRTNFTYIKTRDVSGYADNFGSGIPAEDIAAINRLYDRGIRFWVYGDRVGDFSVTNDPLGAASGDEPSPGPEIIEERSE